MKSRILPLLLACASANLAHAQFNPVALTPSSYTFDIVVEASAPQALPYCINVTAGSGTSKGDNTYYEQGLYARAGQPGGNSGIPIHNTTFTNINNPNMQFVMPPDYTANNDAMVDSQFASFGPSVLTFNTPVTATNLAILNCGGGGTVVVNYTVTHSDSSTETGTLNLLDWFTGGGTVAWGANGRITSGGGYNNYNSSAVNNNAPYLYANQITVSGASPVASVTLTYVSGQHANFFAVSGNNTGFWTPIPLAASSFNVMGIVPATFPLTATMDQGTNTLGRGNVGMNTWFENGFDRGITTGLPASGTTFTSLTQPTHTYQMGDYSANNAILIDTNHQTANITPANPTSYSSFAFLTAGGNVGGNPMTNTCILQHADGVNETNIFYGYDWYDNNHPGSIAYKANGRVDMNNRTINSIGGNSYPYLFESYFILNDTTSPVTNIVLHYGTSGSTSSTTFIMAVSAASGAVAPVVNTGPNPSSQSLFPGTNASFTVGVTGTQPITGFWQVQNNGTYYNLTDGLDANGSIISGSQTTTLTISNIYPADATNYQYIANNVAGTAYSPAGTLIVITQTNTITPADPVYYGGNNIPLTATLNGGPAVGLQWFYIDNSGLGVTNLIAGATNSTYTVANVPAANSGYTYGIISSNIYGVNAASVVISGSDSAAFLGADLAPLQAEAYAGAPVTYAFNAQGNSPMTYQWTVNGNVVSGVNSNSYTLITPCGGATIQVAFSNQLSGGTWIYTSQATLQGDANPTNITFNVPGAGWRINTNGTGNNLGAITNGVLLLTDGGGGEGVSTFYTNAQYVGGAWTASFTYNSHAGSADGMAFILQTTNLTALGGSGGQLGYGGINNSLAFEINLYNGNSQTIGATAAINGATGVYQATGPVSVNGTNDIVVVLNWANGVLSATLTDALTGATFSTNYNLGPLTSILGGNVAYIGFSGGDGGATSVQTVKNFSFHSVLPAVPLTASPVSGGSFTLSWSAADPAYVLQTSTSLAPAAWVTGPTPTNVGGVNQVSVNVSGGASQKFYRLVRIACP